MANLFIIRDICNTRKVTLKQLCQKINLTEAGMQRILRLNKTTTDTLELIASELDVPISVFFDDAAYNNLKMIENKYRSCLDENYLLTSLIGEMRFRLSNGQLKNDSLQNNLKYLMAKYPEDELTKHLNSIDTSLNFDPFSIDIQKFSDEVRAELKEMNQNETDFKKIIKKEDERQKRYLEKINSKVRAFIEEYPVFKDYQDVILDFIKNEISPLLFLSPNIEE